MSWLWTPACVALYLLITLAVGLRATRGRERSVSEHVVAGRGMPLLLVFFIAVGEIYSALSFLGQPGWAYAHGVAILYATMNGTLVAMVCFWLGPKVWAAGKERSFLTQAQLLGSGFRSPAVRSVAAGLSLLVLIPYVSVQISGAGYAFRVTTGGRIPYWAGSLAAFSVAAFLVARGGLRSISWVAVFKGLFMLLAGSAAVVLVVIRFYGSPLAMFARIASESPRHLTLPGAQGLMTPNFWSTSLIVGICGFYMWPHLFQNFFGARDEQTIKRQAALIPLYNVIGFLFLLVGFAGILVLPRVEPDTVMVEMVVRAAPPWLAGVFCAGALSAGMVTASAASLVAAATAANDLIAPRFPMSEAALRTWIQALGVAVMAAGWGFAMRQSSTIAFIMLMAYGFITQLFPLVLVALLRPGRIPGSWALAALGAGLAVAGWFTAGPVVRPFGLHPGFLGMCANFALLGAAALVTKEARPSTA